jgi:hypothetical protein
MIWRIWINVRVILLQSWLKSKSIIIVLWVSLRLMKLWNFLKLNRITMSWTIIVRRTCTILKLFIFCRSYYGLNVSALLSEVATSSKFFSMLGLSSFECFVLLGLRRLTLTKMVFRKHKQLFWKVWNCTLWIHWFQIRFIHFSRQNISWRFQFYNPSIL